MSWRAYLAELIYPEAFEAIHALEEDNEALERNFNSIMEKLRRALKDLHEVQMDKTSLTHILNSHNEVHVILGIDLCGVVYHWEAHFVKATAERRRNELDMASELEFKNYLHQAEQMCEQPYSGKSRFIVLSMPIGSPDKGKTIELLQAKEAAGEPAEEPAGT